MGLRVFQDGSRKDFPTSVTRVVLGRDPQACQVIFPPGDDRVARRHCEILAEVGHWKFKLDEDLPVFVNGRRAAQDQEFDERSGPLEVRLGTREGPLVVLEAFAEKSAAAGKMVETRQYKKDKGAQGRIRRLYALTGGLAALVLIAVMAVVYLIEQKDYDLRALIQEQSATAIDEALINEKIRPSVYLVIKKSAAGAEVASATAWVVARDRGLLATNAHVAAEFFKLAPGETLLVRQPQPPYQTHLVTGVEIHPGYEAFDQAVRSYQPVIQSLYGDVEDLKLVPAYDVGLLVVDGKTDLAPDLPLAQTSALEGLDPGARLAYVGYPSEGSVITVQTAKPSPTTQPDGAAVAVTDYFNVRREDGLNQLVQHNLPATGGASGSPIVNAAGEVVAVLSGGNVIITPKGRAPSAVGINFAQRADVLAELLDGTAPQHLEAYRALWADGLALFDSYEEALPTVLLGDLKKWAKRQDDPLPLAANEAVLGAFNADQGAALWTQEIEAPAGSLGVYAIAASRPDGSAPNIDLMVVKEGERLALNKQPDGQPLVGLRLDQPARLTVVVYGADAGVAFRFWAGAWPAVGN